jgi:hypothetical protein
MLQGSSLKSMTGVTAGTPAYMAPEQVTGHEVGPAADRYSLATIAYEMLTGSIPFAGQGVLELLYAHVHLDPELPSSLNRDLNQSVDAVVMRGLAKDPKSRWGSCEAFVTALASALGAKTPQAIERTVSAPPPMETADAFRPFAPPPETVPSPVWPPSVAARQRSRTLRNVMVSLAVLALLALIISVVGSAVIDALKPTVALSSATVRAGETITVNANHLPANQAGEVELFSVMQAFPFTADGNGNVSVGIIVPADSGVGDHVLRVCWNASCQLETVLHVTAVVPSPSPTPSPTAIRPSILLSTITPKIGGPLRITGGGFDPGKQASVAIRQGTRTQVLTGSPFDVHPDGSFTVTVTIPRGMSPGAALIVACSYSGAAVQPAPSDCASKAVRVQR